LMRTEMDMKVTCPARLEFFGVIKFFFFFFLQKLGDGTWRNRAGYALTAVVARWEVRKLDDRWWERRYLAREG